MFRFVLFSLFFLWGVPCYSEESDWKKCSKEQIVNSSVSLIDEIVFTPGQAHVALSEIYGCSLSLPRQVPVYDNDNYEVGQFIGFYQAPTVTLTNHDQTNTTYLVIESNRTGEFVAVSEEDSRIKFDGDSPSGIGLMENAIIATYNSSLFTSGLNLKGPNVKELLENRNDFMIGYTYGSWWPEERRQVQFVSHPEKAEIWRGSSFKGNTVIGMYVNKNKLKEYRFVLSGYKDCFFEHSVIKDDPRNRFITVECNLERK